MKNNKKEDLCKKIYAEYVELRRKTRIETSDATLTGEKQPQEINPEDFIKKESLRRRLVDCLDVLDISPEERLELESG